MVQMNNFTLLKLYFAKTVNSWFRPNSCMVVCVSSLKGTLETGAVFDTSNQPNRGPLPFKLGEGKVIPGIVVIQKNLNFELFGILYHPFSISNVMV